MGVVFAFFLTINPNFYHCTYPQLHFGEYSGQLGEGYFLREAEERCTLLIFIILPCYKINMLLWEVTLLYMEMNDVPATNSLTKITKEAKIWVLTLGGVFVTISILFKKAFFIFADKFLTKCMIVSYISSYSFLYLGSKA